MREAVTRHTFEQELKRAAGATEDAGGTAAGPVHRAWGDLKANFGGGHHTLLATAEQGEDAAKKAYEGAPERQGVGLGASCWCGSKATSGRRMTG